MTEAPSLLHRSFPADPGAPAMARRAVRGFLVDRGVDARALADVLLALSEVVTNAVVHGYRGAPGEVAVEADDRGDVLLVSVTDAGTGMAPRHDSPGLGLGLPLVSRVADQVEIASRDAGGTLVTMRFPLDRRST